MIYALSTAHQVGLGLVALAWVVFSLLVSIVIPRYKPDFPGPNLPAFLAVAALFFVSMLFAVFFFGKESESKAAGEGAAPTTSTATTTAATATPAQLTAGKAAWDKAACGGCHTLKAAGATGTVGPNLDQLKPAEATVERQVTNGGAVMPAFKGVLTPAEIKAVAVYVSTQAGKG